MFIKCYIVANNLINYKFEIIYYIRNIFLHKTMQI